MNLYSDSLEFSKYSEIF